MLSKFPRNPLVSPADIAPTQEGLEVMCAFNPGAAIHGGKTVLLIRVAERPIPEEGWISTLLLDPENPGAYRELRIKADDPDLDATDPRVFTYKGESYLTSISHLRLATSTDGRNFTIGAAPAMRAEGPYEEFGIEDPRICYIAGWYHITYSAISSRGVTTCLARTRDFAHFERLGIIFCPDNKDIALFPEKIGGRYYCFHRPSPGKIGRLPSTWLASSDNLRDWGNHQWLFGPREGMWDCERTGCGASPIKTRHGWLQIYHASDNNTRYCSGAILLGLDDPTKVIARSDKPILEPTEEYETSGFLPNVCFHNGWVDRGNGKIDLYYGAADWVCCGATLDVDAVLDRLIG